MLAAVLLVVAVVVGVVFWIVEGCDWRALSGGGGGCCQSG
jgi:hypothetical protein